MEIKIAESSGFCCGVRKAVDTAMHAEGGNIYILGEIIHNKFVTGEIEKKGRITINNIEDVPDNATLIIRSHGTGSATYEKAAQKGLKVIDCTCVFVEKTRDIVKQYYNKGYAIVIIGSPKHPEVEGLNGWCGGSAVIIPNEGAVPDLSGYEKLCIVAQTTESSENFDKIIKNIKKVYNKTVEIFKTICYTTIKRQKEADELSKSSDAVIVLGGFNSSNTGKLYDICRKNCANVFRAENPAELNYGNLTKYKKIAIVSGASTPDEQTQEVFSKMENSTQENLVSANEVMEQALADIGEKDFKKGQIIKATIASADDEGLAVLLPLSKKETSLKKDDIDCQEYDVETYKAKIGDEIEVMITGFNPLTISEKSIKKIKEEEARISAVESGEEFFAVIDGSNKGGLTAKFGTYFVFVPASEIRLGYESKFEKYIGKKMRLKMLEIKKDKKKEIIASQKVILAAEKSERDKAKAEKEKAFFESIAVGDVVEGKVERFSDFGAFVSVKGFDCLAHISDLSWTGVKTPGDVLALGQTYNFKVLKINEDAKKVSIGYKQLQPEPWDLAAEKYAEGGVVTGTVVRIAPFGAFIEIERGIDALVRVSEISHEWIEEPTSHLAIGQQVDAQIILLDVPNKKMTLSIKALLPAPERIAKPKREKPAGEPAAEGEVKRGRKPRLERRPESENEIREWNEGGDGGASIGEMLNLNK